MGASANPQLPALGEIVGGRYRLESVLGQGGIGTVFKAEHINMRKSMAVKMLTATKHIVLTRFKLEATLASQLNHPNIISIVDFDEDRGCPYLVMDYVKGKSLERILEKGGPLPTDRFEKIMLQACSALAYAHKQGVIHRDLKTSNLMITERGGERDFLIIVDFGLIKVITDEIREQSASTAEEINQRPSLINQRFTEHGVIVGSPGFMSPEQVKNSNLDQRSDIYSLGCVMYYCLTGKLPLEGAHLGETLLMQCTEMPEPFSIMNPNVVVPPELEAVVMKALAKEPADRHQSMDELADDIKRSLKKRRPLEDVDASLLSNNSSFLNPKRISELHGQSRKQLIYAVGIIIVILTTLFVFLATQSGRH